MTAFAYYRLPYLHHATQMIQHEGEPEVLGSVAELNGKEGFVVAPFAPSSDCPVVLIHPDEVKHVAVRSRGEGKKFVPRNSEFHGDETPSFTPETDTYAQDFAAFHERLKAGDFQKIVLARRTRINFEEEAGKSSKGEEGGIHQEAFFAETESLFADAESLFMEACQLYPRLFVALVYTEPSGMWLMATPEILLKGEGTEMTTMSLAGTQRAEPSRTIADYPVEGVEWSQKNQEEQQYVTDYITQCVSSFTDDCTLKGPYTTMAANLYHLRTDIRFSLRSTQQLGDVLEALYPTPAVCGIPKEATRQFILTHEHHSRQYYSGFVGPLQMQGKTHLYVSLRCMHILPDAHACDLYAGGGLLRESEMQKEWEETEAKMQTIKRVLGSKGSEE